MQGGAARARLAPVLPCARIMPRRSRPDFGRQALGMQAEDLACRALEARGYAIVERRHRTRFGEIDIIARDRGVLVFVEVKSRRTPTCGPPAAGVTARKRERLLRLALMYLQRQRLSDVPCRFDVVSIHWRGDRDR